MPYSLGIGGRCEAQVDVVCNKTKLMRVLLKKEPNVSLLLVWAKQGKALLRNDAVGRAIKQKVLFIFNCLHCTTRANTLLPRGRWGKAPICLIDWILDTRPHKAPICLNTKCASTSPELDECKQRSTRPNGC